ncbi:MAG: aldehyde dehydrogenase family protein, partial [Actinomycetes bacterium]
QCGMVSINSVIAFAAIASLPFGGVKDSGNGRIHGPEGLMEFTYARSIVSPRFAIPIVFTTFKRTKFADKFLIKLIKSLHSKVVG